jgi:hypothetical protein
LPGYRSDPIQPFGRAYERFRILWVEIPGKAIDPKAGSSLRGFCFGNCRGGCIEASLKQLVDGAGVDWDRTNFEVVLSSQVVNGMQGKPKVEAIAFW